MEFAVGLTLESQMWFIKFGKNPSNMYLTAIIDWYSRMIVGWKLSYYFNSTHIAGRTPPFS